VLETVNIELSPSLLKEKPVSLKLDKDN